MEHICQYCGKTFKTDKGFEKHNCKYKQRMTNFNHLAYALFNMFLKFSHLSRFKEEEKQKMKFIKSHYYNDFDSFAQWCVHINIINVVSYMEYLCQNQIEIKNWKDEKTLRCWLYTYLRAEPEWQSINRSKKFLDEKLHQTLDQVTSPMLYLALRNGFITKKYMDSIGFNYKDKLLISPTELNQLVYFLEG